MNTLTPHQSAALDRYRQLQSEHPELFRPRVLRPIVTDRAALAAYAAAHGEVLGVAAETKFYFFLNDLVQPAHGDPFPYSRLISKSQLAGGTGVAVLAVIRNPALGEPGHIVLVEQERHATGVMEWAIPRGFGAAGRDGAAQALLELREETGYSGDKIEFLGESVIDSGAGDARVLFYRVDVIAHGPANPEREEAIRGTRLVSRAEILESVAAGGHADSFTLQALALEQPVAPAPLSLPVDSGLK